MELSPKQPENPSPRPHPKVSAAKYAIASDLDQNAKMKWRIKGNQDGPVYQGQAVIIPCSTCGGKNLGK